MSRETDSLRREILKALGAAGVLSSQIPGATARSRTTPYADQSDYVRIGNAHLELAFRRDNGGVAELIDKTAGSDLRSDTEIPALSCGLRFYHPEYDNLTTASYMAGTPTINVQDDETTAAVRLQWSNPELKAPPNGRLDEQFNGESR